jgi:hypothetical protein
VFASATPKAVCGWQLTRVATLRRPAFAAARSSGTTLVQA